MANKIFITTNRSLFTYHGESLDLFNPPDESDKKLYTSYFKFINSVLAIYRTSRCNGSIPVFWTKIDNTEKLNRIPDHASTLRKLDDKNSYFIILEDSASLPLEIPSPINFDEFSCSKNSICLNKVDSTQEISCNSLPVLIDNSYQNIELTSNYIHNISIPISGLLPNKKYYYNITPTISNWPAKIYPVSGFIERSGPTNAKLETFANLELLFSYLPINGIGNVPQTLNNQNGKNVFSFLNFTVTEENCNHPVLQDNINIVCNDCLGSLASGTKICPELTFDANTLVTSQEHVKINLQYKNLDITKNNYYSITSSSANWPINISSLSGLIIPQTIYTNADNNKLYGSGLLSLDFTFNKNYFEPYSGWSNLNYTLDSNYTAKFIKENIYSILKVDLISDTDCEVEPSQIIVICDDCLTPGEESCINSSNVVINETNTNYYDLSQQRPGAEKSIDLQCCDQDRNISVFISNICPEEEYDFKFIVNPYVPISPVSGSFVSSSNTFEIKAITNLNNLEATNIECIVTHKDTQDSVSDSMILRCGYCEWIKVKDLKEIYSSKYILSNLYSPTLSQLINPTNLIVSNNDGSSFVTVIPSGYMYSSQDKGINWNKLQKHNKKMWSSLTLAKDNNDIYLTTGYITDSLGSLFIGSGEIYKSTDYGDTLSQVTSAPSGAYSDIDISNDGQFIIAAYESGIVISNDYGNSWPSINITGIDSNPIYRRWSNVSITNDGSKIALSHLHNVTSDGQTTGASVNPSGRFLVSIDGGIGWETKIIPFESGRPVVVKYSKDGSTLAGIGIGGSTSNSKEYMYLSYDNGDSWYPRVYSSSIDVLNNFEMSDDGSRFILYGNNNIYQSKDQGINWNKYSLSSINSDEILSIAKSSGMDILCALSQNNTSYSLNLYNCPSYKN